MLKKLWDEKLITMAIGLVLTALNLIVDELVSDTQILAFAGIVAAFLMRPKRQIVNQGVNPEQLTDAVEIAMHRVEEQKKKI